MYICKYLDIYSLGAFCKHSKQSYNLVRDDLKIIITEESVIECITAITFELSGFRRIQCIKYLFEYKTYDANIVLGSDVLDGVGPIYFTGYDSATTQVHYYMVCVHHGLAMRSVCCRDEYPQLWLYDCEEYVPIRVFIHKLIMDWSRHRIYGFARENITHLFDDIDRRMCSDIIKSDKLLKYMM